jgi:predicted dienelactone hydrolase
VQINLGFEERAQDGRGVRLAAQSFAKLFSRLAASRSALCAMAALVLTGALSAQTFFSVPPADAPELAPRGSFSVGVRTLQLVHAGQVDILHFDKATGKAPLYDRPLPVEVWYPAIIPAGVKEETRYKMPVPGGSGATFEIPDKALRDATPVSGKTFPLVIVSHGYPGSRYFLSYLTANLASKGYVVAAIDHTDSVFDGMRGFESTLLNRSSDQLFTISRLAEMAAKPDSFLHGLVDASNVAVVGYSMGGYGALTTAGAGYSDQSMPATFVPGGYLKDLRASSPAFHARDTSRLKAIVAIAPWGEQPPYKSWDAEGLAGIKVPSLFIAGDKDDVADYASGIRPAFEMAVHSERCLLVYENARHNTGGNPPPPGMVLPYGMTQAFDEPAWRKERITSINQHFITAFLDLYLKGDSTKAAYLHVAPEKSNDGKWEVANAQRDTGEFSSGKDAGGNLFWKGFQRRGAVGLEMSCRAAQ